MIAIARRTYTQAKHDANKRYDSKTYKYIGFNLRLVEDADIIKSISEGKEKGLSNREWLREIFEGRN